MSLPLASIILPTHNRKTMLLHAIESVIAQTYQNWELIVVNDASEDGTDDLVRNFMMNDSRISYIQNRSSLGGSGARNAGIAAARGHYVSFLDDDDRWMPDKLEKQIEALSEQPEAVAASCWYTANSFLGRRRVVHTHPNPALQELLSENVLGGASVCMIRRSTLEQTGGFSEDLPSAQDWDFWVRLRIQGPIVVARQALVSYMVHSGGKITTDLEKKYIGTRRFYRKHRPLMTENTKRHVLSFIAYIRSRRANSLYMKFAWLAKCVRWSGTSRERIFSTLSVLYHIRKTA